MSKEFTTKEKVLVNLLEFYTIKDRYPRPVEMTQEGMAQRTGSKQNTISYAVRDLVDTGYIYEETTRVKGKKQRLKAYFLTDKGVDRARDIRYHMAHLPLEIVKDGMRREVLAKDINNYFHTTYSLLDIILRVKNGHFQLTEAEMLLPKVAYLDNLTEMGDVEAHGYDDLLGWWSGDGKILLIEGEGGVGKTTLITRWIHGMIDERNIFYCKLRKGYTCRYLWEHFARFLSSAGEHKLNSYLEATGTINFKEALRALLLDLEHLTDTLLIIEDIYDDENLLDDIIKIVNNISSIKDARVIMTGEPGLVKQEKKDQLGMDVLSIEHGDCNKPIFTTLGDCYDLDEGCDVILDVILEGKLTPEEFIAVSYLSIHRLPVERKDVLDVAEVNKFLFNELLKTPIISTTKDDRIFVHDLVRDKILYRLWREEKEILHSFAEEYYHTMPGKTIEDRIEFLYHAVRADDVEGFILGLDDHAEDIIRSGYGKQLIYEIESIDRYMDDAREGSIVKLWKGEAYITVDEYEKALEEFESILKKCENSEVRARAHIGIASVMEKTQRHHQALEEYGEAERHAKKLTKYKKRLLGIIYQKLSNIHGRDGDYTLAKDYIFKAISLLEEQKDYSLLTTSYLLSAQLEKEKGDPKKAIALLEKGMKSWRLIEETYQRVGGLHDIGSFYKVIRELEGAEEFLTEAADTCEQFGYTHLKGLTLLTLTECHIEKGEYQRALSCAGEAKSIFNFLDLSEEEAYSYALLGQACTKLERDGEAEGHFNKAITIYHKINSTYALGLVYFSMAKLHEKNGNKSGVAENYRKSVISLISSGADEVAEQVERVMKSIPLTM